MKKLVLFFTVIVFTQIAFAQTFSGGVRTGKSLWFTRDYHDKKLHNVHGQNMSWDKGIFLRYDAKSRFSMGFGITHNSFKNDYLEYYNRPDVFDAPYYTKADFYDNNFEMEFTVQLDVTCNKLKACPLLKNIESYVGLSITPVINYGKSEIIYQSLYAMQPTSRKNQGFGLYYIYTGLNHTIKYNLDKNIYVTSTASLAIDPFSIFSEYVTDPFWRMGRVGLQIGAGYNF